MFSKINNKYVCTYLVAHSIQTFHTNTSTNKFWFCVTIVNHFIIILIIYAFYSPSIIWRVSVSYNTIFHRIHLVCHGTKRKISTRLQVCCISLVAGVRHVTLILQSTLLYKHINLFCTIFYQLLKKMKSTKLSWKRLRKNWTARVLIVYRIFIF